MLNRNDFSILFLYAITILRTFYNFCYVQNGSDKQSLTPAQRIGLTNKVFDFKDIIYMS